MPTDERILSMQPNDYPIKIDLNELTDENFIQDYQHIDVKSSSSIERFECNECGRCFKMKKTLKTHLKFHHNQVGCKC